MVELIKSEMNGYYCNTDPGEPGWNRPRLSINDSEARFISEFARDRTVLEIGTGLGVSTRKMAEVAKYVYTVDIDPWVKDAIAPNLPDNVYFFSSINDYGIMPGFDMAFVDGCHDSAPCLEDINNVKRLVKVGGVILFHDYHMSSVSRACAMSKLNVVYVHTVAGVGVAWND